MRLSLGIEYGHGRAREQARLRSAVLDCLIAISRHRRVASWVCVRVGHRIGQLGPAPPDRPALTPRSGGAKIVAVGAENQYANVIAQIGGPFVSVSAVMSNPNTDPHEFEASASVAEE